MGFVKSLLRVLCLISLIPGLGYAEKDLKYTSIKPNMDLIFHYHVENRSFSPLVVKRSFKIYIEQFDSDKIYLLKDEVNRFLNFSDEGLQKVIKNYSKEKYDDYILLNTYIERSIERQRRIRTEVFKELLAGNKPMIEEKGVVSDYARNEAELKERLFTKFYRILYSREKKGGEALSLDKKTKILALFDKKLIRHESFYYTLGENGEIYTQEKIEHYTCLHILKAMTKSLDSHSSYYSYDEAADLKAALKKEIHGIGIVLKENEEGVYIFDMLQGGPAMQTKKIQVGDYLVAIDGKNVQDCCFEEVLSYLRGDEGSAVELTLKREAAPSVVVEVKREKIVLNEERLTYSLEPHLNGYIAKIVLPGFYDNGDGISSEKDLRDAIKEIKSKGKLHGLVIDLRENSGGFLTQAVKVAGLFITKGIVVISKYSDGEIRYMRDLDGRLYYDGPLVLLTSKASASAAEIVAQALQDYGVAVIVGDERTYGKGSMQYQTVTEDHPSAYFKVTVGRYYTISGRSPQIEGVKADIIVETIFSPYNIGERYLEYPISRDQLFLEESSDDKGSRSFQKKYMPILQSHETSWKKMIPILKANSEKRLLKDKNYQAFLRRIHGQSKDGLRQNLNFGVDDLQLKESVNIVKDMIYLKDQATASK